MLKPLLRSRSMASLSIRRMIAGCTEPEVWICWPEWWSGWNGNESEVILSTSQENGESGEMKPWRPWITTMHAVVEEIRLRDLHPSDKHLSTSSCAGLSIDRIRGEGDATAWTQGLSCLSGEGLISLLCLHPFDCLVSPPCCTIMVHRSNPLIPWLAFHLLVFIFNLSILCNL